MSKSYIFIYVCVCARHFYQKPIQTVGTTRVVAKMARRLSIVIWRVRIIKRIVPITRMVIILSQDSLNYFEFC